MMAVRTLIKALVLLLALACHAAGQEDSGKEPEAAELADEGEDDQQMPEPAELADDGEDDQQMPSADDVMEGTDEDQQKPSADEAMEAMDTNQDGRLTADEIFGDGYDDDEPGAASMRRDHEAAFKKADANGDGGIDKAELPAMIELLSEGFGEMPEGGL